MEVLQTIRKSSHECKVIMISSMSSTQAIEDKDFRCELLPRETLSS
jgi:hypothetical protein